MADEHLEVQRDEGPLLSPEETPQRTRGLHELTLPVPAFNFDKILAGMTHLQITSQIITNYPEFGQLQRQLAEIALVNSRWQEQMAELAHTIIQSAILRIQEAFQASSAIADLSRSLTALNEAAFQRISSITEDFDNFARSLTANLAVFDITTRFFEQLDIFRFIREHAAEEEAAIEAFQDAGWPIAPSMPRALIRRVVELHQQGRVRYASQSILGYYRRKECACLAETVEHWRDHPLFASRMSIIEDALWAHRQRRYTLSVPALMAQIEGVMSEYVVVNGLPVKLGKISQVYEAVVGDPMDRDVATWAIAETLLYQLRTNTYLPTPFEDELARSIPRRHCTRHTVLHGIMPGYDRESHSLRAFLLLDALSVLRDLEISEEGES